MALDQYYRHGTDLFQKSKISKTSQFFVSLEANNGGGAVPSDVCSGKKDGSAIFVLEAGEEYWYLDEVMTATDADGSELWMKFREFQTKFREVYTELPTGLVGVVQMPNRSIAWEEQSWENDLELKFASGALLKS